jgi:hypothetical protein
MIRSTTDFSFFFFLCDLIHVLILSWIRRVLIFEIVYLCLGLHVKHLVCRFFLSPSIQDVWCFDPIEYLVGYTASRRKLFVQSKFVSDCVYLVLETRNSLIWSDGARVESWLAFAMINSTERFLHGEHEFLWRWRRISLMAAVWFLSIVSYPCSVYCRLCMPLSILTILYLKGTPRFDLVCWRW